MFSVLIRVAGRDALLFPRGWDEHFDGANIGDLCGQAKLVAVEPLVCVLANNKPTANGVF